MTEQPTLPGMHRRPPITPTGEDRKRRGVEQVLKNERARWRRRALECTINTADRNMRFTADDIQAAATRAGLGPPHHPNVWGAVIRSALLLGVMEKTGHYVKGTRPEQHSRMIPEYRRVEVEP